jgi:membrane-associated PAP2 superfamily phosphatase
MSLTTQQFWWRYMRWPLVLFVPLAILFAVTELDVSIANALFFDDVHRRWIGAHNFWIESVFHDGGRWTIRGVVAAGIAVRLVTFRCERWRSIGRSSLYFVVAGVLGIAIVGLLKTITNVDCPWDLDLYGGRFPLVRLFADRPDALRMGHCFPAAHASSGYALVTLYFAFREWSEMLARLGLAFGLVCGIVFGLAQQSRGAHFISHDLWSAFLIWLTAVSVYTFAFAMQLRTTCTVGVVDGTLDRIRNRLDAIRWRNCGRSKAGIEWDLSGARPRGANECRLRDRDRDSGLARAAGGIAIIERD